MPHDDTVPAKPEFAITKFAWWAIGVAIGFALTFWLDFGMMMELSPTG